MILCNYCAILLFFDFSGYTVSQIQQNNPSQKTDSQGRIICYLCNKTGHIARNCRQRSFQSNNNNRNTNNSNNRNSNVECYNCGRKGHIAKNCRMRQQNNNNYQNNGNRNNGQNNNTNSLN